MERTISIERQLAVDYDAATIALRDRPRKVVMDDPEAGTLTLHAEVAGFDVARTAATTIGEVRDLDRHAIAIDLRFEASERPRGFPAFEGIIELSAVSSRPALSQLALVGRVQPPLGMLGSVGEAAGGTQLGDAVLTALVDRIAARLVTLVAERVAASAAEVGASRNRARVVLED